MSRFVRAPLLAMERTGLMRPKLTQSVKDQILNLRVGTELNLFSIAKEVGVARGSVQRVCESANLGEMGRRGKWQKGCPQPPYLRQKKKLSSQEAAIRIMYRAYRQAADRRGLDFNLSLEQFSFLVQSPCHYCGLPSRSIVLTGNVAEINGVDRVDSNLGYSESNCVPCCKMCNYAKRDMPLKEFEDWIKRVAENKGYIFPLQS
jgi:hypothetical protein